jgi:hypothetical protein
MTDPNHFESLGAMSIQQPTDPKPDVGPPQPAEPPAPDVVHPPTPQETPEKDIPIGVPDQVQDPPSPAPPQEIPRGQPPEVPPSPGVGRN